MAQLTWIAQTVIFQMIAPLLQLDNPSSAPRRRETANLGTEVKLPRPTLSVTVVQQHHVVFTELVDGSGPTHKLRARIPDPA